MPLGSYVNIFLLVSRVSYLMSRIKVRGGWTRAELHYGIIFQCASVYTRGIKVKSTAFFYCNKFDTLFGYGQTWGVNVNEQNFNTFHHRNFIIHHKHELNTWTNSTVKYFSISIRMFMVLKNSCMHHTGLQFGPCDYNSPTNSNWFEFLGQALATCSSKRFV